MTFYFIGNEDEAMGAIGSASISTTANSFRSAFNNRCSWNCGDGNVAFAVNRKALNLGTFWSTARQVVVSNGSVSFSGGDIMRFYDNNMVLRLRLRTTANPSGFGFTTKFEKLDASGTATQLGSDFTFTGIGIGSGWQKVDCHVVYAVSGTFEVYLGGLSTPIFSYTGDITTNSVTALGFIAYGATGFIGGNWSWSEFAVSDFAMLSGSIATIVPTANGNTHNFDSGSPAASNINETTLSDLTYDGSSSAGQRDQYTIPSLPSGAFSVGCLAISMRAAKGTTGPTKLDMTVRSGGTDYDSSDFSLQTYYDAYQNFWTQDPATSAAWLVSNINAVGFNIGLKSVA